MENQLFSQSQHTRHRAYERVEHDWYVEPLSATERLLQVERPFIGQVFDPCCGQGNIAKAFNRYHEKTIYSADLVKRSLGFGYGFQYNVGSFEETIPKMHAASIVTNPPFNLAQEVAQLSIDHTEDRVCMFLRMAFLEGKKRSEWLKKTPLARVWLFPDRVSCVPGHLLNVQQKKFSGATAYAWFVWEKNHTGARQIDWLPIAEKSENKGAKLV